ncbi:MAG: CehA/McbA family metallohydrolase [Proteobacteria bacterium]|nr:CehA/McbA family metallohydrolase [Pseudomonadota bacterium]
MFKIDMHIHTVLGKDSIIQPEELVPMARQAGLDAVCVTEHHSFELSRPFDEISQTNGFPVFRGVEYKAMEGHLLIYGVNVGRGNMPPQMPMQHVLDWVHQQGGVAVPAHPFQANMFGQRLGNRLYELTNLWAVETDNGSASILENQKAGSAADKLKVGKTGGSDAHGPKGIGKTYTVFPEPIRTMAELVSALKTADYYPDYR